MAIKYYLHDAAPSEAWSSGGNMVTARWAGSGFGTATNAVAAGGKVDASNDTSATEQYSSGSWAARPNPTNQNVQQSAGSGTFGAGLISGGARAGVGFIAESQEYDGTTWAMGGNLSSSREFGCSAAGTQTATVLAGGFNGSAMNNTAEYDGTTWTETGTLSAALAYISTSGTQTAGLACGGYTGAVGVVTTQEYDGATWAAGGNMPAKNLAGSASGTQTNTLSSFGYNTDLTAAVKTAYAYDGASWSTRSNASVARHFPCGGGSSNAAIAYGGYDGITAATPFNTTELYTANYPSTYQSASTPDWIATGGTVSKSLSTSIGVLQASVAGTTVATTSAQNGLIGIFTSAALGAAQTIGGGNIVVSIADKESNLAANFFVNGVDIYVWRPSTDTKVGTVKAFGSGTALGAEPSAANSEETTTLVIIGSTAVDALAGDVVVIELWARHTQGTAAAYTVTTYYDGTVEQIVENTVVTDHATYVNINTAADDGITPGNSRNPRTIYNILVKNQKGKGGGGGGGPGPRLTGGRRWPWIVTE